MENIYLFFVIVLFALAISDLVVGVSNDAINFLNSAIGSKVATRNMILFIASIGIIIGATFSNGMMEVARKGIFHPQHFMFTEIMAIFLAVMLTDIILLDFFNTLGLPTSTTVSIVFELLGAAVAISVVKLAMGDQIIVQNGVEKIAELTDYINSGKALAIISGILLSVVVAFSVGLIVQWISRLIFSFNYKKSFKYFGSIWGGLAITAITYFILMKGLKGSTYASYIIADIGEKYNGMILSEPVILSQWVKERAVSILGFSFIGWSIILQIFQWLKINILKIIVLVGTFALAMAFAGNDLVNFIGVPLAGFHSFEAFRDNGFQDLLMTGLAEKVTTPPEFLIIAGIIMVFTLWLSKKARSVSKTELGLSRQDEGDERFGSSFIARLLVRRAVTTSLFFDKILPDSFIKKVQGRFDQEYFKTQQSKEKDPPNYDLIRASVNLTVASILIALATSLKLPLSTTYVTFMVSMGTSLADGAWGRESAVYRITGVITVIGGWFFTAFVAFTIAFLLGLFILKLKLVAVIILVIIAFALLMNNLLIHKKKTEGKDSKSNDADEKLEGTSIIENCQISVLESLKNIEKIFRHTLTGLNTEDRKLLKKTNKQVDELNLEAKELKSNVHKMLKALKDESTGPYYVQVIDYLREIAHSLTFITRPSFDHIDNNHKGLLEEQVDELNELSAFMTALFNKVETIIKKKNFEKIQEAILLQAEIMKYVNKIRKNQIKRIKKEIAGTRNSILYLAILNETKNLILQMINLLKAQRDFVQNKEL